MAAVTSSERRINGVLFVFLGIGLLLLQIPEFLPASDDPEYGTDDPSHTKRVVDIITYLAVLQPLYSLYKMKKWPTMTLLLTVVVVHVIQQTCNDWKNACIPGFDLIKQIQEQRNSSLITEDAFIIDQLHRQEIGNVLTVFSYLHLFASASEKPDMLATLQPLLVLVSVLAIFINQAALALVIVGLFATARTLRNVSKFSLIDYLLFVAFTIASITFFFLDMSGYFYVLYCCAFTFMAHSAVRVTLDADGKSTDDDGKGWFLQIMRGKRPAEKVETVGSYGQGGLGLTRVDIQ